MINRWIWLLAVSALMGISWAGKQREIDFFNWTPRAKRGMDLQMSASEKNNMIQFIQNGMGDAFKQAEEEMSASNAVPERQSLCCKYSLKGSSLFLFRFEMIRVFCRRNSLRNVY